jgi:hypothetical protein
MTLKKAKLVKLKTADGNIEVNKDVPIGKEYNVDIDSIFTCQLINPSTQQKFSVKTIEVYENDQSVGWFFTELLDIEK